jgi:hypothetical protein
MKAFELTTHIDEQGNLHLPRDYSDLFGKHARVILLVEESTQERSKNTLEQFVGLLKGSPSFNQDPVAIQRELRDEWC